MSISKEQIFNTSDVDVQKVEGHRWGEIYVRTITAGELDQLEKMVLDFRKGETNNLRAAYVAVMASDENGNRIFNDNDVEALGKKSAKDLSKIFNAGIEFNKIDDADIEQAEKNS